MRKIYAMVVTVVLVSAIAMPTAMAFENCYEKAAKKVGVHKPTVSTCIENIHAYKLFPKIRRVYFVCYCAATAARIHNGEARNVYSCIQLRREGASSPWCKKALTSFDRCLRERSP